MSDEVTPRPGTTASIERRVERLEVQQDELQRSVNVMATAVELVKVEQGHMKELMGAKFNMLEAAVSSLAAKFDAFALTINSALSDPEASPAGRHGTDAIKRIHERIDHEVEEASETHSDIKDRLEAVEHLARSNRDWIVRAGGVLAVALFLATLFAPVIRSIVLGGAD